MKYMVMFVDSGNIRADSTEADARKTYEAVGEWWGRLAAQGKIGEGYQLQPASTATTVVLSNGESRVVDGPFLEAKETVGGYGILEVADLDEAIAIARTWPVPDSKVEVRPLVPRQS